MDNWEVEAVECLATGVTELVDKYSGSSGLESSDAEKYLGDVICKDGKNKRNIEARKGKGLGAINQIMNILEDVTFGPYYFEVAIILRNSLLINSILTNSEAWLGLSLAEVEQLEQVDESLLRKILEVGKGCPKEMLFLELGCIPIRFTLMMKVSLMKIYFLLK